MDAKTAGLTARRIVRAADRATLSTKGANGWPYGALVLLGLDLDGTPLLMLSSLAQHTRHLLEDDRVAVTVDGTFGFPEPLAGPRLTVLGRARRTEEPRHRARFLARHPSASRYADFTDFAVYRVAVDRIHLVAGFGEIRWLEADRVLLAPALWQAFAAAGSESVDGLNTDRADLINACAARFDTGHATGWRITGIDPDGCDLRHGQHALRLAFAEPCPAPDLVPVALERFARDGPPPGLSP
ncbi:MAG: HugZ family protein [Inquilinaceae bacterium]